MISNYLVFSLCHQQLAIWRSSLQRLHPKRRVVLRIVSVGTWRARDTRLACTPLGDLKIAGALLWIFCVQAYSNPVRVGRRILLHALHSIVQVSVLIGAKSSHVRDGLAARITLKGNPVGARPNISALKLARQHQVLRTDGDLLGKEVSQSVESRLFQLLIQVCARKLSST